MDLQNENEYKHYWAYYLFTLSIFLLIVYAFVDNADIERYRRMYNPRNFLLIGVLPPTLFAFCSYQLFPHETKGVDLKEFFFINRWKIFLPGIVYAVHFTSLKALESSFLDPRLIASYIIISVGTLVLVIQKYWLLEVVSVLLFLFAISIFL
jgi:hypothetical protein